MTKHSVAGESRVSASDKLKKYAIRAHKGHDAVAEEELSIKRLFASRSAHLPGNNWCQDWIQWMMNNHPLLALCCRHRLNPVGLCPRLIILLSSISFGMIATNLVYLFYRSHPDANATVFSIVIGENDNGATESLELTYEAIVVWTLGGLLHSLVDLGMWHLNACACCMNSWFARLGPLFSIAVAALLTACSTFAILWRANYEDDLIDKSTAQDIGVQAGENDWMDGMEIQHFSSFQFLITYYIELASVWLFYYPIMATFFFSGALWGVGWGCIGGRPKEIQRQKDEAKRKSVVQLQKGDTFNDDETFEDDTIV